MLSKLLYILITRIKSSCVWVVSQQTVSWWILVQYILCNWWHHEQHPASIPTLLTLNVSSTKLADVTQWYWLWHSLLSVRQYVRLLCVQLSRTVVYSCAALWEHPPPLELSCKKRLNQALSVLSLSLAFLKFLLGCQYQYKWLTGKTRLRNDL